jgi:hypothetical protein
LGDPVKSKVNDNTYSAADWAARSKAFTFTGTKSATVTGPIMMNEDLDPSQTLAPTTYTGGQTWSITSAVIAGSGPSRPNITLTIDDITQVKTGNYIFFTGTLDEAGNAVGSGPERSLAIYDFMGPFITSAITGSGTATNDTLTVTFSETVDKTTAETIGSYVLSAGTIAGGTAVLQTDGKTVIITTAADGDLTAATEGATDDVGTYLTAYGVKDYQIAAVATLANTYTGGLHFAIDDQIPAVATGAANSGGTGDATINNGNAVANDGDWEVGDTDTTIETYNVILTFSEAVFVNTPSFLEDAQSKVAVSVTPSATYLVDNEITNVVTAATATTVTVQFFLRAGQTVAAGDKLSVSYEDAGGLSGTATVTLGAAGAGAVIANQ